MGVKTEHWAGMKHSTQVQVSREFGVTCDFLKTINEFVSLTKNGVLSVLCHSNSLPSQRVLNRSVLKFGWCEIFVSQGEIE